MGDDPHVVCLSPADASLAPLIGGLIERITGVEGTPERVSRLADEIADVDPQTKAMFVTRTSERVVGFSRVAMSGPDNSEWWILGLFVHPEKRRQGLGTALVLACIEYARERGAPSVMSMTHPDNVASIRCHESIGFEPDGRFVTGDGVEQLRFRFTME